MKASQIRDRFHQAAPWINPETTVDRIIIGNPDKEVRKVLVTWMCGFPALREAAARGTDMIVCHEPTFWVHAQEFKNFESSEIAREKRRFIEEHNLVILRIHDIWDSMPGIGIPFAWARFLELGETPVAKGENNFQHRYDIEPVTLEAFGKRVARKTAAIGEDSVQVIGDLSRIVSRIGIGTGCICGIPVYQKMGCDVAIVCDDGSCYWQNIQQAKDMDYPVIRVNHGTSEEAGMVTLTQFINDRMEGVQAEHLPHGCSFRLVGE